MSKMLYEEKVIHAKGARHYLVRMNDKENFIYHRFDGPAIVPVSKESEFKKTYFLWGFEYSADDFKFWERDNNGIPFHKTAASKGNIKF
jgi:hypothetical protein|tara:strand:- start:2108 stop:2374 length:267 start_codon:yes stop_codon:yes gene_type:complete